MTCEDYVNFKKKKNEITEEEKEIEQLRMTLNLKNCPHCGIMVDKDKNCKFTYCSAKICKKNNKFCWLCLAKLNDSEHFSHFFNSPYGEFCINIPK